MLKPVCVRLRLVECQFIPLKLFAQINVYTK